MGACQGVLDLMMALQMVSSLRIQAVSATLGALPATRSRWQQSRMTGLCLVATSVAKYSAAGAQFDDVTQYDSRFAREMGAV